MGKRIYLSLLVVIILIVSCKKNESEGNKIYFSTENEFKIVKRTQKEVVIQYKVKTNGLKETGIIYSLDSTLIDLHNCSRVAAIFNSKDSIYTCDINNIEPNTKYWAKIYFKTLLDSILYSQPYTYSTSSINVTWISFNKTTRNNTVILASDIIDLIKNDYTIKLDTIICNFNISNNLNFNIIIPQSISLGNHKLLIYYKDKIIFADDLYVFIEAAFEQITRNPKNYTYSNSFLYNNEIYIYNWYDWYDSFWKWSPQTNVWTQLPAPNINPQLPYYESGYEINGKIYFPPLFCTSKIGLSCSRSVEDEKVIYSYDPNLGKWEKNLLINHDSIPEYVGLYSGFVYNNKLYCFVSHSKDNHLICLLKVFDPKDFSWTIVFDSFPFSDSYCLKSVIINNKIFILNTLYSYSYYASTYFKNELYQLDIDSKVLVKKSMWDTSINSDVVGLGTINSYFFEYQGNLYTFGGEISQGYIHEINSKTIEYNIESDKWNSLLNSGVIPPRYSGMVYKINDNLYLGMGGDNISEIGCYIYKFSAK